MSDCFQFNAALLQQETFPEFYKYCCEIGKPAEALDDCVLELRFPDSWQLQQAGAEDKIVNMTNGVTPRRWVHCANPALSAIFTKYLGSHERLGSIYRTSNETINLLLGGFF